MEATRSFIAPNDPPNIINAIQTANFHCLPLQCGRMSKSQNNGMSLSAIHAAPDMIVGDIIAFNVAEYLSKIAEKIIAAGLAIPASHVSERSVALGIG